MASAKDVTVVLGAAGATGLECVKRLVELQGPGIVRAVVRDPAKLEALGLSPNEHLQIVRGDVTDVASLREVLAGARGVIFAAAGKGYWSPAEVDFKGVANTATVSKELGVKRVVLVSSMLVTKKNWLNPIRLLLNNIRYGLMDNKLKGEDALRASGVEYTIVRPGGLGKGPGGQSTVFTSQGDTGGTTSINRADVAAVCVEALANPAARNVTVEVGARPGVPEGGYDAHLRALWAGLKPDDAPARAGTA